MAADDLVSGVLTRISHLEADAREAAKYSSAQWDSATSAVVDLGGGDLDDLIPVPASPIANHMVAHDPHAVLRLCRAHRQIVELFPVSEPHLDTHGSFYGFQSRDCGEHRTVGPHRAWCFDCSEWCYPAAPCARCHGVHEALRILAVGLGVVEEDQ
jgi:hypothetical protein